MVKHYGTIRVDAEIADPGAARLAAETENAKRMEAIANQYGDESQ